jgi:hypothetical protein
MGEMEGGLPLPRLIPVRPSDPSLPFLTALTQSPAGEGRAGNAPVDAPAQGVLPAHGYQTGDRLGPGPARGNSDRPGPSRLAE